MGGSATITARPLWASSFLVHCFEAKGDISKARKKSPICRFQMIGGTALRFLLSGTNATLVIFFLLCLTGNRARGLMSSVTIILPLLVTGLCSYKGVGSNPKAHGSPLGVRDRPRGECRGAFDKCDLRGGRGEPWLKVATTPRWSST